MILAVDIGNTNIVIGCLEDEKALFVERISTEIARTELEYVVQLNALLSLYGIDRREITGGIISSVVPPLSHVVASGIRKLFGFEPMLVGPGVKTGLNIQMDDPGAVGADLIVNAVAGLKEYGAPLILIDMGTATTISVINDKRAYIGGMILPGIRVSLESLVSATSQLPKIALEPPKRLIGKNTIDSMKSGMIYGQASALDGMIDRIFAELGTECRIVATGDPAQAIAPWCRHNVETDNSLTMKGLYLIYDKNMALRKD